MSQYKKKKRKKSGMPFGAIIGSLILILMLALVFFLLFAKERPEESESSGEFVMGDSAMTALIRIWWTVKSGKRLSLQDSFKIQDCPLII